MIGAGMALVLLVVAVGTLSAILSSRNDGGASSTASLTTGRTASNATIATTTAATAAPTPLLDGTASTTATATSSNAPVVAPPQAPPQAPPPPPPSQTLPPPTTPSPTSEISEISQYIQSQMPGGGLSLQRADSYQSRALAWVENSHKPHVHDPQRALQRFVLACIYYATNQVESVYTKAQLGENAVTFGWSVETAWLSDEVNECNWHGIQCNYMEYIQEIDLSYNNMTGEFPPEVGMLRDSLEYLILAGNTYLYNWEHSWLSRLWHLRDLDLSSTAFHANGIPGDIGLLTNLETLDVSFSLYHGELRDDVFNTLTNLQSLSIGGLELNSPLPPSIGNLTKLLYFFADNCKLTGNLSIWTTPEQLPELKLLWIDNNPNVVGTIPTELGQYSTLVSLSLTGLGLSGAIPTQLGELSKLEHLRLWSNSLNSTIPSQLANLTALTVLKLEDNDFNGAMPSEICARMWPVGVLETLEADCDVSSSTTTKTTNATQAKVMCAHPECCTCCGEQCTTSEPETPVEEVMNSTSSGDASNDGDNDDNGGDGSSITNTRLLRTLSPSSRDLSRHNSSHGHQSTSSSTTNEASTSSHIRQQLRQAKAWSRQLIYSLEIHADNEIRQKGLEFHRYHQQQLLGQQQPAQQEWVGYRGN